MYGIFAMLLFVGVILIVVVRAALRRGDNPNHLFALRTWNILGEGENELRSAGPIGNKQNSNDTAVRKKHAA